MKKVTLFILFFAISVFLYACKTYPLINIPNNIKFAPKLSEYNIYENKLAELKPKVDFNLYELATPLFTDYAEKQRLIKLPKASKMKVLNDKLPEFPEGTIIVKTFFYYKDKKNLAKGKKVIETRLLIKEAEKWNVATYVWNEEQTEAFLQTEDANQKITWLDDKGRSRTINYHIPSNKECSTCHQTQMNKENIVQPLGLKLRNLNFEVERASIKVNQLKHFETLGLIEKVNTEAITSLTNWQDQNISVEKRARAYFEINCAHCHNAKGLVSDKKLYLDYELDYNNTGITKYKNAILKRMDNPIFEPRMPKLGNTVVDEEGLALVKQYINTLGKD